MPEFNLEKLYRTTEELCQPEESDINGNVPEWVNGIFLRIGPGKWDFNGFSMNHWLDGYCILSKFEIANNKVTFHKKFLQSDAYKRAIKVQRPVVCEFGTKAYPDPNKSFLSRFLSSVIPIELSDNDQLSLFMVNNEVFATSETSYFRKFNLQTLETLEKYDTNKLFGTNIWSAHPLTDIETGITYNIGATCLTGLKYHIIKIPPSSASPNNTNDYLYPSTPTKDVMKKSKIICSISTSWIGMMSYCHSFGMTKNYLVFIEQPYVMNITKAFYSVFTKGLIRQNGYSFKDWLDWRPEYKNKFFIIEKSTGKIINGKFDYLSAEPFFFLHIINCYEYNNQIIIDINGYSNPALLEDGMMLSNLRNGTSCCGMGTTNNNYAIPQRFVLPLFSMNSNYEDIPEYINLVEMKSDAKAIRTCNSNIITLEPENLISESGIEFPRLNSEFIGRKYMYFYATGSTTSGYFENSLCKVNCKTKKVTLWKEGTNYFPGEPIFISNPNRTSENEQEDDGILISAVTDVKYEANDLLLFLDAKNMKELGRVQFKAHIPQAIHGLFIQH